MVGKKAVRVKPDWRAGMIRGWTDGRVAASIRRIYAMKILVLHGPNLQLLGTREPGVYGRATLDDINRRLAERAGELGVEVACGQYNGEGELVSRIGGAPAEGFAGIVINPAAYTHTSVALRDALLAAALPAVEVHLSNPAAREEFRHRSLTAPACIGQISGFGADSYLLALDGLAAYLRRRSA